ncbi:MAG: hypothetical protein Q8O76_09565, partial [Chloroflexota bacterium]|nr:hypothetical protein [Chloroflexota bacterium]
HRRFNTSEALKCYERSAGCAPAKGYDRGIIFREWGILFRDSGFPNGVDLAIEKLVIALQELPSDPVCRYVLGSLHLRKGAHRLAIEALEPLKDHSSRESRLKALPLLIQAYRDIGDDLRRLEAERRLNDEQASRTN